MTWFGNTIAFIDVDTGQPSLGSGHHGMPHFVDYHTAIGLGKVSGHESFRGFGYDSAIPTTITDVSGRSLNVNLPTTAIAMEVVSSSASDAGTVVTSGTSTGGSTITLIDAGKNFVALGVSATTDYVLNDTDVIIGDIVSVDSATQITFQPQAPVTFSGKAYRIVRAASTGAAVVEHHGLDSAYNEQSEYVVLNGVTPVSTTKNYLRSNNFHNMIAGSGSVPAGNISLRDDATGTVTYNFIQAGLNMSLQAHFTVPAGKAMYIPTWHAGSSGNKPFRVFLRATADFHDRGWTPTFQVHDVIVTSNSDTQHRFDLPIKVPAKADMKISAAVIGSGTGECGVGWEYWLE